MSSINELVHWNKSKNIPVQKINHFGQSLVSLQKEMEQMLHNFFDGSHFPEFFNGSESPAIDVIENPKGFQVNIDLAGVDPENIEISVTDGFLTIEGEKEEQVENKEGSYLYQETNYGSFQRTIALPATSNCDKAEASFKNGVLKVMVPKKAEALKNPKKINIKKAA